MIEEQSAVLDSLQYCLLLNAEKHKFTLKFLITGLQSWGVGVVVLVSKNQIILTLLNPRLCIVCFSDYYYLFKPLSIL